MAKSRDPIIQDNSAGIAGGGVKRGDKLNGEPRTKSISGGGPNFTGKSSPKSGWPTPDSPYGKG